MGGSDSETRDLFLVSIPVEKSLGAMSTDFFQRQARASAFENQGAGSRKSKNSKEPFPFKPKN